jgi:hypothetical protein
VVKVTGIHFNARLAQPCLVRGVQLLELVQRGRQVAVPLHVEVVEQARGAGLQQHADDGVPANKGDESHGTRHYMAAACMPQQMLRWGGGVGSSLCALDVHARQHELVSPKVRLQERGVVQRRHLCCHAVRVHHGGVAEQRRAVVALGDVVVDVEGEGGVFGPGGHGQKLHWGGLAESRHDLLQVLAAAGVALDQPPLKAVEHAQPVEYGEELCVARAHVDENLPRRHIARAIGSTNTILQTQVDTLMPRPAATCACLRCTCDGE